MRLRLFALANLFVAAVFTCWALFQHNDPDPMLWMILYGLAALACVLFHLRRLPPEAAAGFAVMVALWGLWLAWKVIAEKQNFFDEEGREMMGSFVIALWMSVLWRRGKKLGMK